MLARLAVLAAPSLVALSATACSSSSGGGGGSPASEGGTVDTGAPDSGQAQESSAGDGSDDSGSTTDAGVDTSPGADSSSGAHNPACCVRNAMYDSQCTQKAEPSTAYVCFCPDGGIDPSCTINPGTELVCCP